MEGSGTPWKEGHIRARGHDDRRDPLVSGGYKYFRRLRPFGIFMMMILSDHLSQETM